MAEQQTRLPQKQVPVTGVEVQILSVAFNIGVMMGRIRNWINLPCEGVPTGVATALITRFRLITQLRGFDSLHPYPARVV